MLALITGTSGGVGSCIAQEFLNKGHTVIGLDICKSVIMHKNYTHYVTDILSGELVDCTPDILINNAGVQNSGKDIDVNLKGSIRVTEKYIHKNIKSILFIASASASTGSEFPEYAASKGGMVAYMKNVGLRVSKYGATCNSLSPGGVYTGINDRVINNADKWNKIMSLTPLRKWATAQEIADWAYFVTVTNKSLTMQDIIIDNGESSSAEFVW